MSYTYSVVNSLTGERLAEVTSVVESSRWQSRLHSVGRGTFSLLIPDDEPLFEWSTWRMLSEHWSRTVVVSWNDVAVFAGLMEDWDWDERTRRLTWQTVELRNEFSVRKIVGVATYDPAGSFTVTNKSRRGVVRALIGECLNRGDANFYWNYPIDLGPDYSGGFSKTYPFYELYSLEEMVQEWQKADGGPDVHLDPEWRSGALVWALKLGDPLLAGATFEWSESAEDAPVTAKLRSDGRHMTTGVFAIGKGEGAVMKVGKAGHGGALVVSTPYRDRSIAHKMIDDQGQLDSLAMGDLKPHFYANRMKTFSLRITDDAHPGNVRMGSRLRLWNAGLRMEPEGWFEGYLIGVSGSTDQELGLEVQSWQ